HSDLHTHCRTASQASAKLPFCAATESVGESCLSKVSSFAERWATKPGSWNHKRCCLALTARRAIRQARSFDSKRPSRSRRKWTTPECSSDFSRRAQISRPLWETPPAGSRSAPRPRVCAPRLAHISSKRTQPGETGQLPKRAADSQAKVTNEAVRKAR